MPPDPYKAMVAVLQANWMIGYSQRQHVKAIGDGPAAFVSPEPKRPHLTLVKD